MCKNYGKLVAKLLLKKNLTVSTAESCTGGLISSMLTDISGSSAFIKSNFVTYSNEAKMKYLDVNGQSLKDYGAVSEIVAKEMANGLLKQTDSDISLGITGIAGPTGGSKEKPVGLAFMGISNSRKTEVYRLQVCSFLPRKVIKYLFAKKALRYSFCFVKENYGENCYE